MAYEFILVKLLQDFNPSGFHKWPFLSVQTWGEDPRGTWTLMVESVSTNRNVGGCSSLPFLIHCIL